jgi:hypothetical protein
LSALEKGRTVHGTNGIGSRRRGRNGEAFGLSINFGPLGSWVGFNLRMAQEAAFQAFSRRSQEIGESPGRFATLTLIARNPASARPSYPSPMAAINPASPRSSRIW